MTYQNIHPVPALLIPVLASPPAGSPTLELWEYYRREKSLDRRLARQIDCLAGTAADRDSLRQALNAREASLHPIGVQISNAILRLPSINAQLALELRYLESLTLSEVAVEMHYSRSGVQMLLTKSLCQLQAQDHAASKEIDQEVITP